MIVNLKPVKTENGIPEQIEKIYEEFEEIRKEYPARVWNKYPYNQEKLVEEVWDCIQACITLLGIIGVSIFWSWWKHHRKMVYRGYGERKD